MSPRRGGAWWIWFALPFGIAYPLSLGPVLWYHKHPQGNGYSTSTLRILNDVYAPLEVVFKYVTPTRDAFDVYCVWLWTQWGDHGK